MKALEYIRCEIQGQEYGISIQNIYTRYLHHRNLHSIERQDTFLQDKTRYVCFEVLTIQLMLQDLLDVASKHGIKYLGSTSTLTKPFSQIYFALSGAYSVE